MLVEPTYENWMLLVVELSCYGGCDALTCEKERI